MLDQSIDFLPLASLVAGLSGSLHCLGMCGGLVTASCHSGKDVLKYQVGRLIGYSLLGSLAWAMGYVLRGVVPFSWAPFLSGLFMGLLFIYWGVQSYQGKKAEVPMPKFLRTLYQFSFRRFVSQGSQFKSFIIGLISILLPCGLIYGLIVAALAVGDYSKVMLSLFFFWLGTLPAMIGAPHVIKKILEPLRKSLPKIYAFLFIVVGMGTILARLNHLPHEVSGRHISDESIHHCH